MVFKYLILSVFFFGMVWAQSEQDINDALSKLPPELQGKVNETQIETIKNQSQQLFKEKCEKNGGLPAYEKAQKAYEVFPKCVQDSLGLSDPKVLQDEIEEAKPRGAVDEVFKKYCGKAPQAKQCFRDLTEAVKPCFSLEEQKNLKTVYNVSEQLAEFICFKDGDRIALFIAEGGPECFDEKKEQIQECVTTIFGDEYKINTDNITANSIPEIAFGEKECGKLTELQKCVVTALESCSAPTSANIVESLFKFARSATPCNKIKPKPGVSDPKARSQDKVEKEQAKPGSASGLAVTSATLITALAVALLN